MNQARNPSGTSGTRRLAAVLSADIVDYADLMRVDDVSTTQNGRRSRSEIVEPAATEFLGRLVKHTGDGFLVEFSSAADAVRCAIAIQTRQAEFNQGLTQNQQLSYRLGVNLGDILADAEDIYGDGVNIAARIRALASANDVLLSAAVYDQVRSNSSFQLENYGDHQLKNIARPVTVWRIVTDAARPAPDATSPSSPPEVADDRPSIAVLPFENMSGDTDQEYFADGISEDLITDLSKISGLHVIARNSVFTFKGRAVNVPDVARDLGVAWVMEGSVRKSGNRVRVTAQLIDGSTGGHLWAERYDGDMAEIFDFQDRIRGEIVAALEVTLTPDDEARTKQYRTESVEAYDAYLKGRTAYFQYTPNDNIKAREFFEQSIGIDPGFGQAYAYFGNCYVNAWLFMWPGFDEGLDRAVELTEKGVELDPGSATAHYRLGFAEIFRRNHDRAIECFGRALEMAPDDAEVHAYYGETLNYCGDYEKAREHLEHAQALDPLFPPSWTFMFGHSAYGLGEYDKAVQFVRRALDRVPEFQVAYFFLICSLAELDRMDEARLAVDELLALLPAYTVSDAERIYPFRYDEVRKKFIDNLRKAGLPET